MLFRTMLKNESNEISLSSVSNYSHVSIEDSPFEKSLWSELRERRGMNTTPNSSLSSSVSKLSRTRSQSETIYSEASGDRIVNMSGSTEWSPTVRKVEYTYYRDEPITASKDSIFEGKSIDRFSPVLRKWVFYLIILLSAVAICFIPISHYRHSVVRESPVSSNSLKLLTEKLSIEFPYQSRRFWTQLRAALGQQYGHISNPTAKGPSLVPAVILFVNRLCNITAIEKLTSNRKRDLASSFQRFISRFGELTSSMVLREDPPTCIDILPNGGLMDETDERQIERLKLDFDAQLSQSYQSKRIRCFHFRMLDKLPPEVVLLFHGVTDAQNSVYKDAVILFSLQDTFSPDNCTVGCEPHVSTHRQFERTVLRHLRGLWSDTLGEEEADALLSRLAPNIAVFHTPVSEGNMTNRP
ncbi:hypothetical protein EG68_02070 [Paragonimus skrjabini miyazakii]|uniref:Torsin n=1 Tax=Paragonimus skrjabini miyazakii TaxID=59628 RepID=A0A8S9YZ07_9TREM|nr:hypothetical protein EG68_02070 [Paragonimus skrjabini miyazakii]